MTGKLLLREVDRVTAVTGDLGKQKGGKPCLKTPQQHIAGRAHRRRYPQNALTQEKDLGIPCGGDQRRRFGRRQKLRLQVALALQRNIVISDAEKPRCRHHEHISRPRAAKRDLAPLRRADKGTGAPARGEEKPDAASAHPAYHLAA